MSQWLARVASEIIRKNTLALINHARPKKKQRKRKMFPSFNFGESDKIFGRSYENIVLSFQNAGKCISRTV